MNNPAETLREQIAAGSRRALAKAITLVESTHPEHQARAEALLAALPAPQRPTLRLGLSGTPGVGKSTFIEAFGCQRADAGDRVAVLAVDPSSARTGGSILGDKTRMEKLARHPRAFIRPSPAQNLLGGVARRTREVIQLVEAAGFDLVIVETVGVGQSETLVSEMTDMFLLLLAPAGGDELQGVKRGIMEIADIILVNKADGALEGPARMTCADYQGALRLMRGRPDDPDGYPLARTVSALTGAGLADAWDAIHKLAQARRSSGSFDRRRRDQRVGWFGDEIDALIRARLTADPHLRRLRGALERKVESGDLPPRVAAARIVAEFLGEG